MTNNIDNMARIEREIEKRMEAACEKNGWVVAVAMMPPETTTLHIEKFCGCLWGLTPLRSPHGASCSTLHPIAENC